MTESVIRVLMVPPNQLPIIAYLPATMNALRCAVSIGSEELCDVKSMHLTDNLYVLYCADFLIGLHANRRVGKTIIAGTFYVVAVDHKYQPVSLTEEQIHTCKKRFSMPEHFTDAEILQAHIDALLQDLDTLE